MIKHIVMWKIKDSFGGKNKSEILKKIKNDLEALPSKIPEIKLFEVGINFNDKNFAYDIVLYSEYRTKEDLDSYQVNPIHKEVDDYLAEVRLERHVVDYEV